MVTGFEIRVDTTNPGQFFACCGLFELTSRLDPESIAHFEPGRFIIHGTSTLSGALTRLTTAGLTLVDPDDETASPLEIGEPFALRLDWWKDEATRGRELKVWAGTMQCGRIAEAMIAALRDPRLHTEALLDHGQLVYDPAEPTKKVEPFYFDARRASNAHSRDVGFSANDLDLTTTAFPAVEALSLIGLQRFRPRSSDTPRVFDYYVWPRPIPIVIASAVVAGAALMDGARRHRFEVWYRTGQKKHKAFRAAIVIAEGE